MAAPKLPPPPLTQASDKVLARWCSDLYQQIKAGLIGGSSVASTTVSTTGTVAIVATETVELVTAAADITRNLPAAAACSDQIVLIKKVDSGIGNVVIDGSGAETIDLGLTYTLVNQYQYVRLLCDGAAWHVIGGN